eukprot:CAMPEP_0175217916 /NCGR_PEP_ID=MMETSP0093-20121207/18492_1 /TAXON_ID=311494 /ORGANISM="Alexandrium monilatum, Strain CCMP3105" /LENGTH=59 /DNA_ID=CAMNT_0016511361 /DNA_START=146 /DNA_END=321 /DNA_ORIENTATION=+
MALKTEIQNRAPSALRAMELVFADPTLKQALISPHAMRAPAFPVAFEALPLTGGGPGSS